MRHPDLRLLLEERKTAAQVRALQLGQLDLGLLHLPLDPDTGSRASPFSRSRSGSRCRMTIDWPSAASSRCGTGGRAVRPVPRELEPHTYDRFISACVASGFAPKVVHQATGLQTMLDSSRAASVSRSLPSRFAANLSRSGVAFVALTDGAPRLVTGPAWRADRASPAVELLRACREELADTDQLGGSVEPSFDWTD